MALVCVVTVISNSGFDRHDTLLRSLLAKSSNTSAELEASRPQIKTRGNPDRCAKTSVLYTPC